MLTHPYRCLSVALAQIVYIPGRTFGAIIPQPLQSPSIAATVVTTYMVPGVYCPFPVGLINGRGIGIRTLMSQ